MMFNLFKRCKHNWKVLSEKEPDSPLQHAVKTLGGTDKIKKLPHQLCESERLLIQIVACAECGEIKKFETKIK